ncbi:MAG: FAD-dependent oxidoreductase [Sporichthyaceae bacterium]
MTSPDDLTAYPPLSPEQLAELETFGTRRAISPGDYLYRAGDAAYDFYVVLSGGVDIVVTGKYEERLLISHGAGRFLGELNLLTGLRVMVSARVTESGDVLVIPVATLREIIATRPALSDLLLAVFMARRSMLLTEAAMAIKVIGSRYSPESARIREYLQRTRIPHEWVDADADREVEGALCTAGIKPDELPLVWATGTLLRRPTPGELAEFLGLTLDPIGRRCFDLVVVGSGPGGLAAAVYGASEGLSTMVVDAVAVGGQAGGSSRIENYLGFPTGISGTDLTHRALIQAEKFGAGFSAPCTATGLREEAGHLFVGLSDGTEIAGRAVVAATGARYRRLPAAGIEEFESSSVFYAATEMEARACASAPVVVVGGGNSAGQAAMFLAQSGSPVTIVIRGADLGASMSRYLVDRILGHPNIALRTHTTVTSLSGSLALEHVVLTGPDGATKTPCAGLFSFIGAQPSSDWLSGCAALDGHGFVLTDRSLGPEHLDETWTALGRAPLPFETSRPGLFAVGDLRSGSTKRVAGAVGEGSASVRAVHEYLAFVG